MKTKQTKSDPASIKPGSWLITAFCVIFSIAHVQAQEPIRLHPQNGHYFLFRQTPVVLMGSSEHYGALINLDFDYVPYLEETKVRGLNLVRVFSGTYRETAGSFNIQSNTLAPATARSLAPWKRTAIPGAADGGNKFDLTQWDPAYFNRLRDLVNQAGQRGIVVELTFFSAIYDDSLWKLSPMNGANHINGAGSSGRTNAYNPNGDLLPFQKALARKCATELNGYDNVIYEICNEPYNGNVTQAWEFSIVNELAAAEAELPFRHLIAQNVYNYQGTVTNPHPSVSIFNFHYAYPNAASQNYGLNLALGDDETGFAGQADFPYRREAWEFMLSGGGLFDHLDFSFTTSSENGTASQSAPGGGGVAIRRQLGVLRGMLEGLPLTSLVPQTNFVAGGVPAGGAARAMGVTGAAYAVYLRGGSHANLVFNLPSGTYSGQWIDTKTGAVAGTVTDFTHTGGQRTLVSPTYSEDIALRIVAVPPAPTGPELLVNGSFESSYNGWTMSGNQSIQNDATHGSSGVKFNGSNTSPNGVLSQTFATTVGASHKLTFDVGVHSYNQNPQSLLVTVNGSTSLLSQVVSVTGLGNGTVQWFSRSFTFVANSTTTTLTFRDQSATTQSLDLLLDHVRVTGPVDDVTNPTPSGLGPASLSGTPGNITVRMTATQAGTYVLESSEDLTHWKQISEMQVGSAGLVEFHDTPAAAPKKTLFYRIGRQGAP